MKIVNFTNSFATKYVRRMANFSIRALIMILVVGLATVSCKTSDDDDDDGDGQQLEGFMYGVKKGTIVYKISDWYDEEATIETHTVIFDDNGKRTRLETGDDDIMIFDAIAGKMYILYPSDKEYLEMSYSGYGLLGAYLYLGDDLNSAWRHFPGFKKLSNKTIAGKNCTVYSWSADGVTVEWGGWNRITFWCQSYEGAPGSSGSSRLEATSFKETIPDNSFTPPSDYTKIDY